MRGTAFGLYLLFLVSWFLHIGSRIDVIGVLRLDLLLVVSIVGLLIASTTKQPQTEIEGDHGPRIRRLILALVIYSIVTLPFVEWPGTVLGFGLPDYVKALVFYFFTAKLVTTPKRLAWFLAIFVGAMTFRILEPLYLHVTTGYWGSFATMADEENMDRLSGAPSDIINPNGLAYVALTVIPFFHYLGPMTWIGGVSYFATLPLIVWALLLTGSRSGFLGLAMIVLSIWVKSRRKLVLAGVVTIAVAIAVPLLPPDLSDRYLSIASSNTKNASTAEGRLSGLEADFRVAMRRPLFGHGLGTSREANANFAGEDMPSHNLYLETLQELGLFGLVILVMLLFAIYSNLRAGLAALKQTQGASPLMLRLADAVQVWLAMNILFSFASYGLRSYEWYLAAGFADILYRSAREFGAKGIDAITAAGSLVVGEPSNTRIRPTDTAALWPERLAARSNVQELGFRDDTDY